MKKSVKTNVLLTLVLGIWGVFLLRLVKTLNPDQELVNSSYSIAKTSYPVDSEQTVELSFNYRDPFLGTNPRPAKKVKSPKNKSPRKTPANSILDKIQYQGYIGGQSKRDFHYFLNIEGKQELFKVGDAIKGIKLLSASASQVVVRHERVTRTIKISD